MEHKLGVILLQGGSGTIVLKAMSIQFRRARVASGKKTHTNNVDLLLQVLANDAQSNNNSVLAEDRAKEKRKRIPLQIFLVHKLGIIAAGQGRATIVFRDVHNRVKAVVDSIWRASKRKQTLLASVLKRC